MEYKINSKPTIYNGTKYRSRLEARWAAFFDLIGWKYQYEPYDFPGWTPDFAVYGSENRILFIEVKPVTTKSLAKEYSIKLKDIIPRVNAIMICSDFKPCDSWGPILAGYQISHIDQNYYYDDNILGEAFEVHWKDQQSGINSSYDIGSAYMDFDGMLWGSDNRKAFLSDYGQDYKDFMSFWVEAGELSRFHYHG